MKKILAPAALAAVAVLALAGCSSAGGSSTSGASSSKTIAMVMGVAGNPFYEALTCSAKAEAAKLGYKVTNSAPTTFSAPEQLPILNGVVSSRPAAAIIAPTDPQAVSAPIQSLIGSGTKVATVDTTLASTTGLTTQVITDNEKGGTLAAQAIADLVGGQGKVMVIQGPQGNVVESARRTGFEKEIAKHKGIQYIGVQYSENDSSKAAQFVTASLAAHPDLAGIFATNDLGAIGVVTGLEQAKSTKVKVVAFDAATPEVNALKNGKIAALVAQQPAQMGATAVQKVVAALKGEKVDETTYVDSVVIKAGDDAAADEYEYKGSC